MQHILKSNEVVRLDQLCGLLRNSFRLNQSLESESVHVKETFIIKLCVFKLTMLCKYS